METVLKKWFPGAFCVSMCHPNINLKYFDHPRLDHRSRVLKEKYCLILTQDFQFKVTVSFV